MRRIVERERNKTYYRILHVPVWIWVFWILPGHLTSDLYSHGPDRRHWIWLAVVATICAWRGFVGRLPGVEPAPYITHYGEDKPNLWYRVICYSAAWIDVVVPFTLNFAGLLINLFTGRWIIAALYTKFYYLLAAVIVLATVLGLTPRARRSTRNEGAEKGWFYVAVWTVVPTQLASWAMWRLGRHFAFSATRLDDLRLLTFLIVSGTFLVLGLLSKLPRSERYYLPETSTQESALGTQPADIVG
jgi:hypothetical protein